MREGRCVMVAVLTVAAACGGGGKKDTTEAGGDVAVDDGGGDSSGGGDVMVPPEKMDEINVRLDRKRASAARCLSDAVLSGDATKSTHGKITLEFVVSPAGKAENVRVTQATLDNQKVQDCVIDKVRDTEFPTLPRALEWSYTFSMDSN